MSDDHTEPNTLSRQSESDVGNPLPPAADTVGQRRPVADDDGQRPTATACDGQRPSPTDSDGHEPPVSVTGGQADTEAHVLTVRAALHRFEEAGVPRSERTVSRWCLPNRHGEARLDAYYDENERRYRITEESVSRIIAEEKAKGEGTPEPSSSEPVGDSAHRTNPATGAPDAGRAELEEEIYRLKIDNEVKGHMIAQMAKEREKLTGEFAEAHHRIGALETELRLLGRGESE